MPASVSREPHLDALFEHLEGVRRLARALVGPVDADDLVQETMLRAYENPPRDDRNLKAWLNTVLRNTARARSRSDTRRSAREDVHARRDEAARGDLPSPDERAARREGMVLLLRAVEELPAAQREVVELHYLEHWSQSEIARELGVTTKSVEHRVKRGLDLLELRLRREYGDAWSLPALALLPASAFERGALAAPAVPSGSAAWAGKLAMAVATLLAVGLALIQRAAWSPGPALEAAAPQPAATAVLAPEPARMRAVSATPTGASAAHTTELTVVVRDLAGRPVAGAGVFGGHDLPIQPANWVDRGRGPARALAHGLSDEQGRARLTLPAGEVVDLVVADPRYRIADQRLDPQSVPPTGLDIRVTPAAMLTGRLFDAAGQPVAQAVITLVDAEAAARGSQGISLRGRSDEQGRFVLGSLPPAPYHLRVDAPGLPRVRETLDLATGSNDRDFHLPDGARIPGVLVDEAGAPVANARLWTIDADDLPPGVRPSRGDAIPAEATTDADGRFLLTGVLASQSRGVWVEAPGRPGQLLPARFDGRTERLELVPPGSTRLLVAQDGIAVPHAEVTITPLDGRTGSSRTLTTDAAGSLTLPTDAFPADSYRILARAAAGIRQLDAVALPMASSLLHVDLDAAAQVSIRVHGAPDPEREAWSLAVEPAPGAQSARHAFSRYLPGTASPPPLALPDGAWVFRLVDAGGATVATTEATITGADPVAVALHHPALVACRLTLACAGQTLTDPIALRFTQDSTGFTRVVRWHPADGELEVALPRGAVVAELGAGHERASAQLRWQPAAHALQIEAASARQTLPLDLGALAPLEVVLRGHGADAIDHLSLWRLEPGARVDGDTWLPGLPTLSRDPETGGFWAANLPPGRYLLRPFGAEIATDLHIVVDHPHAGGVVAWDWGARPAPLRGRLVDASGQPLAGHRLALTPALRNLRGERVDATGGMPAWQPAHSVLTGSDGSFRFDAVRAGQWQLLAENGLPLGPGDGVLRLASEPERESLGDVVLPAVASVRFTPSARTLARLADLRAAGEPARVELVHQAHPRVFVVAWDSTRSLARTGLPAGPYAVRVGDETIHRFRLTAGAALDLGEL